NAKRRVNLDRVLGLSSPSFGHKAVDLLDASFGVLSVATHVPLANGAVRARNGIRAPDDTHHEIAFVQSAGCPWIHYAAERFMAEHEARLPRSGPSVLALCDLHVGSADSHADAFREHRAVADIGFRDIFQLCEAFHWLYGDRLHFVASHVQGSGVCHMEPF